jgi:hypothetical protein
MTRPTFFTRKRKSPPVLGKEPGRIAAARIISGNAKGIACTLVARRIGVISACGAIVIVRGYYSCTDGSGTDAHTHATTHIGSAISAAPIDATHMNTARADAASIS